MPKHEKWKEVDGVWVATVPRQKPNKHPCPTELRRRNAGAHNTHKKHRKVKHKGIQVDE